MKSNALKLFLFVAVFGLGFACNNAAEDTDNEGEAMEENMAEEEAMEEETPAEEENLGRKAGSIGVDDRSPGPPVFGHFHVPIRVALWVHRLVLQSSRSVYGRRSPNVLGRGRW